MPGNKKYTRTSTQHLLAGSSSASSSNQSGNASSKKRAMTLTGGESNDGDNGSNPHKISRQTKNSPGSANSNTSTVTENHERGIEPRRLFEDEERFRKRLKEEEVTRNDLNIYMKHGFEMVDLVLELLAQFNNTNPAFEASVQMVDDREKQLREGLKQAKEGYDKLILAVSDL